MGASIQSKKEFDIDIDNAIEKLSNCDLSVTAISQKIFYDRSFINPTWRT